MTDGAPGETAAGIGVLTLLAYTGITGPLVAKAALGIKNANCPSDAGTIWNPPYNLEASDGKPTADPPLHGILFSCEDPPGSWTMGWLNAGCGGPAGIWCCVE